MSVTWTDPRAAFTDRDREYLLSVLEDPGERYPARRAPKIEAPWHISPAQLAAWERGEDWLEVRSCGMCGGPVSGGAMRCERCRAKALRKYHRRAERQRGAAA